MSEVPLCNRLEGLVEKQAARREAIIQPLPFNLSQVTRPLTPLDDEPEYLSQIVVGINFIEPENL